MKIRKNDEVKTFRVFMTAITSDTSELERYSQMKQKMWKFPFLVKKNSQNSLTQLRFKSLWKDESKIPTQRSNFFYIPQWENVLKILSS